MRIKLDLGDALSMSDCDAAAEQFQTALQELGWLSTHVVNLACRLEDVVRSVASTCWLRRLYTFHREQEKLLTKRGSIALPRLLGRGVQLYEHWPGVDTKLQHQWLGKRWYLCVTQTPPGSPSWPLHSIASSQLGRNQHLLPEWPELVNWALQAAARQRARILINPGTTLSGSISHFARIAGLQQIVTDLPAREKQLANQPMQHWLAERLAELAAPAPAQPAADRLLVSPADCLTTTSTCDVFQRWPLQDRVAMLLADRVYLLHARPGGTIEQLAQQRLADQRFPIASVYALVCEEPTCSHANPYLQPWLDRGAVGCRISRTRLETDRTFSRCQARARVAQPTLQLCCAAETWLRNQDRSAYLTHCTRTVSGPPQESESGHLHRVWLDGHCRVGSPLHSLLAILHSGQLRGSNMLVRGNQPMVSLSQVPLLKLLSRRKYQRHLARWDWEPYGIMFAQSALPTAQAVRYGSHADGLKLSLEEQSYFQPTDDRQSWEEEREWRIAGGINLRELPSQAATVFVQYRHEALQVAAHSSFPVLWIHDR